MLNRRTLLIAAALATLPRAPPQAQARKDASCSA